MTEILLNALVNLLSVQAALLPAADRGRVRDALAAYLCTHLHVAHPEPYLELYDAALALQVGQDRDALILRATEVAGHLRARLPRVEQIVFLQRCVELAVGLGRELAVVRAAARELAIDDEVLEDLILFADRPLEAATLPDRFLRTGAPDAATGRRLPRTDFVGRVCVLRLVDEHVSFIVTDRAGATLDAVPLAPGAGALLVPGAIVRDAMGGRLYEREITAAWCGENLAPDIVLRGQHVDFRYPGSDTGLHDFSFQATSGQLVGIMGLSGAGKSTLLSILTGQLAPDSGSVAINGIDVHRHSEALEGVIGMVPQDDLLFEDLTVFQNLYYSACLCLAHLAPAERRQRVETVLADLQQLAIRDLKVGSPLERTISGGQRKRLNIALELIRSPSILVVDEPTSGLSSADSEHVMDLLKALASRGRLVLVVIHQPSSRVFRMFDALWVLGQGGRPLWQGHPLDALVHFRTAVHRVGMEDYACPHCGSVNPEQLFEIIEARALDSRGRPTDARRVTDAEWHEQYRQRQTPDADTPLSSDVRPVPERQLWRPGWAGQISVFFRRTLEAHLANRSYLAVTLLEPPVLALLAALVCRGAWGRTYVFGDNDSLSTYFFISVVVALFLGLSVSAEEITRDRQVLQRERFLHLSWPCYVGGKTAYVCLVACVQMALFTLVANTILRVPDLGTFTWFVLVSCAMAGSMLGLNVSASFRSAVTVYILIPLLLVPQIMLGGSVVPFETLIHHDAGSNRTPIAADLMAARWGFEALVVEQYTRNRYMQPIFADHCEAVQADYLVELHVPEVRALADYPLLEAGMANPGESTRRLLALRHELERLEQLTGLECAVDPARLVTLRYTADVKGQVKDCLRATATAIRASGDRARARVQAADDMRRQRLGTGAFDVFVRQHHNRDLDRLAMNTFTPEPVRLSGSRLVQSAAPICEPVEETGGAHFLAAAKRLGPWRISTPALNICVLWMMSLALYAALTFEWLPRALRLWTRRSHRSRPTRARRTAVSAGRTP